MIITFTGAHSTGKSTLLDACKTLPALSKYEFVTEVTRRLKRTNALEINDHATDYNKTQTCIMQDHVKNTKLRNAVLDRCLMDGFIYTLYLYNRGKVSSSVLKKARNQYYKGFGAYSVVFYTDPRIPLVNDGVRSIDLRFRTEIVKLFEEEVTEMNMFAGVPIIRLQGTVEKRLSTISKWLDANS